MRRKPGRPTKLTPAVQAKIIALIAGGQFRATAAMAIGVCPETVCRWMTRSERRFRLFRQAVLAAEARLEAEMVESVTRGAAEDPQLALRLLERRFPRRWGRGRDVAGTVGDDEDG